MEEVKDGVGTILSRTSSSSMAASCSSVSFPESSSALGRELDDPLGMTGAWQATCTEGIEANTGSDTITGSVSICTHTHTHTHTERH